jgi:hypothetical protein
VDADGRRIVAAAGKNLPNCWALGGHDRTTAKASARVEYSERVFLPPNSEWATSIGTGVGVGK